jgi:hypothetical protein
VRSFRVRGGEDGPGCDNPGELLESIDIENRSCCELSAPLEGISTGEDRAFPFCSWWDVCLGDMARIGLEEDELWRGNGLSGSHSVGFIASKRRSGGPEV